MPSLIQGRVVYPKIPVADPQGQNPKPGRPFVVISNNNDIKAGGPIYAAGITSIFDASQADIYVPLPYGPTAKSGLKRESAAVCTWVIRINPDDVDVSPGFIHLSLVDCIVENIERRHAPSDPPKDD